MMSEHEHQHDIENLLLRPERPWVSLLCAYVPRYRLPAKEIARI